MKLPLDRAVGAAQATLLDARSAPAELHVSTDTRSLRPGDTFVALRGDRFDGHDYVAQALQRGAAMLVLDRAPSQAPGVAVMLVSDTLGAYMALAGLARELFAGRVVAITGSAGKTTTKAFLTQLLTLRYGDRVLAAPGNENNEIGVSKLMLHATNELHDVLVVEMGARRYGDIAALVEVARPEAGVLTNVGEAHLEIMGSRERLEETKWALFGRGARAILNMNDGVSLRRAPSLAKPPHWFFAGDAPPAAAGDVTALVHRTKLLDVRNAQKREFAVDVRVPGLHNVSNLAAAAAAASDFGVAAEEIAQALADARLPEGRFEAFETAAGFRVIYDAYNANASGMLAALDAFVQEPGGRRIAVLASMAELGEDAESLHERVGAHAAKSVDVLVVEGDFAAALARGAEGAGFSPKQLVRVETNAQAAQWLRAHGRSDDVVLLKGSRKYAMEEIVEALRA